MKTILVFKANIGGVEELEDLRPSLDSMQRIERWTIDLDDCDKVLRVESEGIGVGEIEQLLQGLGYVCEELSD